MINQLVSVYNIHSYDEDLIGSFLPDDIFNSIKPSDTVILKPNWIKQSHLRKPDEWDYIITHPSIITVVIQKVINKLNSKGKIIIIDGPQTDSNFQKIIARYPVYYWKDLCKSKNINLEIVDLRDDEWVQRDDVTIKRVKLPGDPKGKTEVNLLDDLSEFKDHIKSKRGYYGADYNISETNKAHDGLNNLYRVSRTVIEGDVFINLPKLKTHKKSGITCCLKNLVGINTYKNFLPHHSEGSPSEAGDQFPHTNINSKIEGPLLAFIKQKFLHKTKLAIIFRPFKNLAKPFFGDTKDVIRSGNWYGNDTIWRTIIDLNKILFYSNADGSLREDKWINAKEYIGIVDAVKVGEGNGPLEPDPIEMGYIFVGKNPVAIDAVCAKFMGFDFKKIPSILNSFHVKHYRICNFTQDEIQVNIDGKVYSIADVPSKYIRDIMPHFGWQGHIEEKNIVK